jgi:hypothetical protein
VQGRNLFRYRDDDYKILYGEDVAERVQKYIFDGEWKFVSVNATGTADGYTDFRDISKFVPHVFSPRALDPREHYAGVVCNGTQFTTDYVCECNTAVKSETMGLGTFLHRLFTHKQVGCEGPVHSTFTQRQTTFIDTTPSFVANMLAITVSASPSAGRLIQTAYDKYGLEFSNVNTEQDKTIAMNFHRYQDYGKDVVYDNSYGDQYLHLLQKAGLGLSDSNNSAPTRGELSLPYMTVSEEATLKIEYDKVSSTDPSPKNRFDLMHRNQGLFGMDDCLGIVNYVCKTLVQNVFYAGSDNVVKRPFAVDDYVSSMREPCSRMTDGNLNQDVDFDSEVDLFSALDTFIRKLNATLYPEILVYGTLYPEISVWDAVTNPEHTFEQIGPRQFIKRIKLKDLLHDLPSSITDGWTPWGSNYKFTSDTSVQQCALGVPDLQSNYRDTMAGEFGFALGEDSGFEYSESTFGPGLHHQNLRTLTDIFSQRFQQDPGKKLSMSFKNLRPAKLHRVVIYLMHPDVSCYDKGYNSIGHENNMNPAGSAVEDPMRHTWDRKLRVRVMSGGLVVYDRYVQGWCELAQSAGVRDPHADGSHKMLPVPYQVVTQVTSNIVNSAITVSIAASEPFQCFQSLQSLCGQQTGGEFTLNLDGGSNGLCHLSPAMERSITDRCGDGYIDWLSEASTNAAQTPHETQFDLLYSLQVSIVHTLYFLRGLCC